MKLNIGCGRDIRKGYVNLDAEKLAGVDKVHDLDKFPYPFKANTFEKVRCYGILEHVDNLVKVMNEIHRICKKNAKIEIMGPHYHHITTFADPTHKRGFTLDTFDYFTSEHPYSFYTTARFKILKKELIPSPLGRFVPFKRFLLNKIAIVLGGFVQSIYFELKVIK